MRAWRGHTHAEDTSARPACLWVRQLHTMVGTPPPFSLIMVTLKALYLQCALEVPSSQLGHNLEAYVRPDQSESYSRADLRAVASRRAGIGYILNPVEVVWILWKWVSQDDASLALAEFLEDPPDAERVAEYHLANTLPPPGPSPRTLPNPPCYEEVAIAAPMYPPIEEMPELVRSEDPSRDMVLYQSRMQVAESRDSSSTGVAPVLPPTTPAQASDVEIVEEGTVVARPDLEPLVVKNHRRVRNRDSYAKLVLAEVRAKFAVPERTEANRLAIGRYANSRMEAHRVRPFDRQKILPFVVAAAFVPTDEDIAAAAWLRSSEYRRRFQEYNGRGSVWCGLTTLLGGNLQTRQ